MLNRYSLALLLAVVFLAVLMPAAAPRRGAAAEKNKLAETQRLYRDCVKNCDAAYQAALGECKDLPGPAKAACKAKAKETHSECKGSCLG